MRIRKRVLPPGWYPGTEAETRRTIERYLHAAPPPPPRAVAGVVPHAGWDFSGALALEVFGSLKKGTETIVVVGGHLAASDGVLAALEEAYETPLGPLPADGELLKAVRREVPMEEDRFPDNTVEVQLPFIKYLFPDCRALAFRAPPAFGAIRLGRGLRAAAGAVGRKIAVVGSTDLTHYGNNYGFSPAGGGGRALDWVKEVNDRGFIENLLKLDAEGALEHANRNSSACSAGGAVSALAFARASGVKKGTLLRYATSCDIYPNESFVGYASIIFPCREK